MLPVVYTPTVGTAIERFSQEFRRSRESSCPSTILIKSRPHCGTPAWAPMMWIAGVNESKVILGFGDQGIGGIEISIGKLSVYTAAAGLYSRRLLPVVLDMGTDNLRLLNDSMYVGERHARVRGQKYDDLIEAYLLACSKVFPHAMLHWEDFGAANARRILYAYSDRICTFNDDMQRTAAVILAALLSATRVARSRLRDQTIVIHGAGTAGLGIADLLRDRMIADGLTAAEATGRFFPLDAQGLLMADDPTLLDFQRPYAREPGEVEAWQSRRGRPDLETVVRQVRPTILIGTSTQPGAFTEPIVRAMASVTDRPIIGSSQ